ncbi:TolB family protein [Lysobacter capsici]|uniref:TolB family protein n=1 Tax=Lysobacter capsici TaxID=435897 RepID=UPI000627F1A2|nr:PD40 domain-containing protein [Lysobacter capsici]
MTHANRLTVAILLGLAPIAAAQAEPRLQLISHAFGNTNLARGAHEPAISADGRFVAFYTTATDIVPTDGYSGSDVFVYDVDCQRAEIVSITSTRQPADDSSGGKLSLSGDGRYVVFASSARNLVPHNNTGPLHTQVYLVDRHNKNSIKLISAAPGTAGSPVAEPGNLPSSHPSISADGRFVAFASNATNLVSENIHSQQIFLYRIADGKIQLVSRNVDGASPTIYSAYPQISADGRYVAFQSMASDLIKEPVSSHASGPHTYIRDRLGGFNLLVDRNNANEIATSGSATMAISGDGTRVSFNSNAYNLWPGMQQSKNQVFVRDVPAQRLAIATSNPGLPSRTLGKVTTLSHDGRYVAFHSSIAGFGPEPGEPWNGLYLIDLLNGQKELLTPGLNGVQENGTSDQPSISADGLRVAFRSTSGNLQGSLGEGVYLSDARRGVCIR